MGYSQSVALLIILIGVLISLSFALPAVMDTVSSVSDAVQDTQESQKELQNTDYTIEDAVFTSENSEGELVIRIQNTGGESLGLDQLTVLVDGEFVAPDEVTVDGNQDRTFAEPGAEIELRIERIEDPENIRVVSDSGLIQQYEVNVTSSS